MTPLELQSTRNTYPLFITFCREASSGGKYLEEDNHLTSAEAGENEPLAWSLILWSGAPQMLGSAVMVAAADMVLGDGHGPKEDSILVETTEVVYQF